MNLLIKIYLTRENFGTRLKSIFQLKRKTFVPRVKLGLERQSFYFYECKLYNELPLCIRKLDTISEFKVALRGHFF